MRSDFIFGAATAAYQIEGAIREDGRTDSIWDTYSSVPGNTHDGDTGEFSDDSYHRMDEDIALLHELGVDAYRFSIGIPRIIPSPDGKINVKGLDHYDRMIDQLLAVNIKPYLTLYHWDLPQYLEDQGGWMNRETAYRMADYASAISKRLGDRVYCYTTLNEPDCSAYAGYCTGALAPGKRLGAVSLAAVHHHNLAHGLMTQAVRAEVGTRAKYSVAMNLQQYYGEQRAIEVMDAMANKVWTEPMLRGRYADKTLEVSHSVCDWSFVQDGDMEIIHQPIDMMGINFYTPWTLAWKETGHKPDSNQSRIYPGCDNIQYVDVDGEKTDMGWLVDPNSFTDLLVSFSREYPEVPLIITENGRATSEKPQTDDDGIIRIHDIRRINYLKEHFQAAKKAVDLGVDLRGYFVWSLLDNFEWTSGYSKRFGLVWIDYDNFQRIPKDSFYWYQRQIRKHSLETCLTSN